MGLSVPGLTLTTQNPGYKVQSSVLPREFENKTWSKNQSGKTVAVEYLMKIYNTKLKFTGFLTDAGNRKDSWPSSFNLLRR